MREEANLQFRLRKTDETRNYHLDEIKYNDLMSEKYKKICKYSTTLRCTSPSKKKHLRKALVSSWKELLLLLQIKYFCN